MPDLHGWITQQIDTMETVASAATPGPWITPDHDDQVGMLEVRTAHEADIMIGYVADVATADAHHIALNDPATVLRRCAADRKILERHRLNPDVHYEPACKGCGTYGDQELSEVDNLNECPELLDLGYAHGLTPEILATLDQPVPPPMPERPEPRPPTDLKAWVASMTVKPTPSVPPALRGPNWKALP